MADEWRAEAQAASPLVNHSPSQPVSLADWTDSLGSGSIGFFLFWRQVSSPLSPGAELLVALASRLLGSLIRSLPLAGKPAARGTLSPCPDEL